MPSTTETIEVDILGVEGVYVDLPIYTLYIPRAFTQTHTSWTRKQGKFKMHNTQT